MTDDLSENEDNMGDTATIETNSGGRVRFKLDSEVRYLQLAGTISPDVYLIKEERSDRKGLISIQEKDGTRVLRVHHRRILPMEMDGKAAVIESQDKHWCLCPTDGTVVEVSPGDIEAACPKCSKTFTLYWIGVKPMADATKTKAEKEPKEAKEPKTPKAEKAEKAAPKPKPEKAPKEPKVQKEAVRVDLHALAKIKGCELWTKKNVKFDHARIDVQAHVLLFVTDSPRKLCFNTYDGALGKKAAELPVEGFVADETPKGTKAPWFPVADLDKARQKLQKDGYEQQK